MNVSIEIIESQIKRRYVVTIKTTLTFDKMDQEFSGFNAFYRNTIKSKLKSLNEQRWRHLLKMPAWILVIAVGFIIVMYGHEAGLWVWILGLVVLFTGGYGIASVRKGFASHLKMEIVKPIVNYLSMDYQETPEDFPFDRFNKLYLIPVHDSKYMEDQISGQKNPSHSKLLQLS